MKGYHGKIASSPMSVRMRKFRRKILKGAPVNLLYERFNARVPPYDQILMRLAEAILPDYIFIF